jgi:hypothetical protein
MKRAIALAAVATVLAACTEQGPGVVGPAPTGSSPTASATTEPPVGLPEAVVTVDRQVWFSYGASGLAVPREADPTFTEPVLFVTRRKVPVTQTPAADVMRELLEGPTREERAAGLGTAIPEGTKLLGISAGPLGGGPGQDASQPPVTVNLSEDFLEGGDDFSVGMRLAQVAATLLQFPTYGGVLLAIEGQPVERVGDEFVLDHPMTRRSYRELIPPILVESPLIGQRLKGLMVVAGTADVFEATVSIRVLDERGKAIVDTFTTATCGSGCRGTYETNTIPFEVSRTQEGVVQVYESSAEDGSPLHMIQIPVTLVA